MDQIILTVLEAMNSFLWGIPLIGTMLFVGVYFTYTSGFFQFRHLPHILKETFGNMFQKRDENKKGILSPFEAVSTAIGGSVGVANMGGVATAIAVGGPGAIFWMWVTALFGLIIKNVEVALAVYYRRTDEEGNPYGGPTYYMERGLGEEKGFKGWILLAMVFGVGIFATYFITVQNYTVTEAVCSTLDLNMLAVSLVYMALAYLCIWKGIAFLGKLAAKLVPFMCLFYLAGGIYIIIENITQLPNVFAMIFEGAFTGTAATGGFAGAAFAQAIRIGMARSVYSNEAGWGTSAMIHSTAKTDHPIKQGLWGSFEVFVDTIIVCSITATIIIITGEWNSGLDGAALTLKAFEAGFGYYGRVIVAFGIFLFGLSTSNGWYTYYEILLRHLFKDHALMKKHILFLYKILYAFPGFAMVLAAVTIGLPGKTVWLFTDVISAIPTFINIIVILILSKKYFQLLNDYKARYMGIGKVDKNFKIFYEDK